MRPSHLAAKLGVKRPSVTRAMVALAQKGLVVYSPYAPLELTPAGQEVGRAIVRRDECLTAFLVEVLGMSREDADPEVHRLEHVLSDEVLARLEMLVEHSQGSKAWLASLKRKIARKSAVKKRIRVAFEAGTGRVHPGAPHEKG